jgi:hypothetical protein
MYGPSGLNLTRSGNLFCFSALYQVFSPGI